MIPVTLSFMALAAAAAIYNAATRASIDSAIMLAVMLAVGVIAGMLVTIQKTKGE